MSTPDHANQDAPPHRSKDNAQFAEGTPLLSSSPSSHDHVDHVDPTRLRGKHTDQQLSTAKLLAVTCVNGGLQVFFSTVMANLAPYLQHLGLSKSSTAAITISLPLAGTFIGPLSGAFSDRHIRTRFGRRRPMIVLGTIATVASLGLLAWVPLLVGRGNEEGGGGGRGTGTGTSSGPGDQGAGAHLAILFTLLLSISIQPIQAGVRALMVDVVPADQQSLASAYASRIQGSMAIFSFFASSLELNTWLPGLWGGLTQFQCLACVNFVTLGASVLVTCVFVGERDSRWGGGGDDDHGRGGGDERRGGRGGVVEFFRQLWVTARTLPYLVEQACKVQFASWWAWFPFTYYNTTYIGELVNLAEKSHSTTTSGDQLAQAGSIGSLCFATVGFFFVLVLPAALPHIRSFVRRNQATEHHPPSDNDSRPRDLIWLWLGTQPVLGLLMVLTLAAAYQWQGTVLVAVAGLPWAVTQWVPWAVIGYETSRVGVRGGNDDDSDAGNNHDHDDDDVDDDSDDNDKCATTSRSGAILGVHNMAISLPQVLSGAVSSVTYKVAESAGSEVPTAWVLASSGLAAFVASFLAGKML